MKEKPLSRKDLRQKARKTKKAGNAVHYENKFAKYVPPTKTIPVVKPVGKLEAKPAETSKKTDYGSNKKSKAVE